MNSLGNRLQDGELQAESLLGSALENKEKLSGRGRG